MAADLSAVAKTHNGATKAVTLNATGNEVVAVTLPDWCRVVTGYGEDSGGSAAAWQFAYTGTDGVAQVADAFEVPSGAAYPVRLAAGREKPSTPILYVSGENSGTLRLHMEGGD